MGEDLPWKGDFVLSAVAPASRLRLARPGALVPRLRRTAAMSSASYSSHSWALFEPVGYKGGQIEDRAAIELGKDCPVKHPPPPKEEQTSRYAPIMRWTTKYAGPPLGTLMYFPLRARAETLKFIMHYGGLNYDMQTIQLSEWPDVKPTMPNGQVPVFKPSPWAKERNEELIPQTFVV